MTYNAQGIGKSGARKRLVEEVIKQTEAWKWGDLEATDSMTKISREIEKYKEATGK